MSPWTDSNDTGIPSTYGELKAVSFNLTDNLFSQPSAIPRFYHAWGLSCKVGRQSGIHQVERQSTGTWIRVPNASRFDGETSIIEPRISDWA